MPRGDRTGPNGAGAMSGRRMGFCVGNNVPGFQSDQSNFRGRGGFGFQHRFGRGWNQAGEGYGFRYSKGLFPSEPIDKKLLLEEQMDNLKKQLNELETQLKNLT
ncbi:MAG: DUF5320 domain-containing protein [Bacteroidales bacterium]|jgi:hypothetical protein|nr:DUF5320 domain-containing protein [Bacteroidales bacterium]